MNTSEWKQPMVFTFSEPKVLANEYLLGPSQCNSQSQSLTADRMVSSHVLVLVIRRTDGRMQRALRLIRGGMLVRQRRAHNTTTMQPDTGQDTCSYGKQRTAVTQVFDAIGDLFAYGPDNARDDVILNVLDF